MHHFYHGSSIAGQTQYLLNSICSKKCLRSRYVNFNQRRASFVGTADAVPGAHNTFGGTQKSLNFHNIFKVKRKNICNTNGHVIMNSTWIIFVFVPTIVKYNFQYFLEEGSTKDIMWPWSDFSHPTLHKHTKGLPCGVVCADSTTCTFWIPKQL